MFGAIILPVALLGFFRTMAVASSHREARRAEFVSERSRVLRQLVELRSAIFRDRLAFEVFIADRRPSEEPARRTRFGAQISDDPGALARNTAIELASLPMIRAGTRLEHATHLPAEATPG